MKTLISIFVITLPFVSHAIAAEISPSTLTFKAVQGGGNPARPTTTLSKNIKRSLNRTTGDDAAWQTVSPASGRLNSSSRVIVKVDASSLAAGTYSDTVHITSSEGRRVSPVIFAVDPVTRPTTKAVTLAWDPNPETDIAGYKVYVGTKSGRYGPPISLGNVTTYTFANLEPGSTYYFVVTAYDKSGNESSPSSEVSTTLE